MSAILYITTVLLSLHAANSYILLTANLDDFNAIAKQIAESPVGAKINQIIRRASSVFNQQVYAGAQPQKRADAKADEGNSFEIWKPDPNDKADEKASASDEDNLSEKDEQYLKGRNNIVERRTGDDVVALGKNASYYLQSIKKIFENV